MNAPYRWLDIIVVLCVLAALSFGLLTVCRSPSPLRGRFKFLGSLFLGLAFFFGGADSLLTLHYAPRSTSVGIISDLTSHGGKHPTCDIALRDPDQTLSVLTGSFSCYGLHTGDQVRIQWMNFNFRIARLDVIAGPDQGSLRNGGDPFASIMSVALGSFLLYAAYRSLRLNPTAIPEERDNQSPLDGDVDEASLLHLSDR
jgi:hypothetical protein